VGGIREELEDRARELGFSFTGVTDVVPSEHAAFYRSWVASGLHGDMRYLAREDAVARRADPSLTMPDAGSLIVVAHEYYQEDPPGTPEDQGRGVIARYARGRDYHRVVKRKLQELLSWLDHRVEGGVRGRAYVDTGPILERELASRAGLGWFGRNTMLIHPGRGSYLFLGVLFVDTELPRDQPFVEDRCGTCRACLEACPTGALLGRNADGAPVMDARRCISYLTIEHRGPIPQELRRPLGNRVYGCDICQEVCPFNQRFAEESREPDYGARGWRVPTRAEAIVSRQHGTTVDENEPVETPALIDLLEIALDEPAWDVHTRGSAVRRVGRAGFARNVCVALGNWGAGDAVPILGRALSDTEPLVRGHAAWALGEIGTADARAIVMSALLNEEDSFAMGEMRQVLKDGQGRSTA
jgi:epoxyqueuosine reductase